MKKRLLAGAAIVLFLAFLAWVAIHRAPAPNSATLADGTVVQLAGITLGQSHQLPASWRTRAGQFAPAPLKPLFGPGFRASFGFGDSGLAAWLMRYDPAASAYNSGWFRNCLAVDAHGCIFESRGLGSTGDGFYMADIVSFPAYPRRQPSFVCRIVGRGGETLGELTLPNPEVSAAPPWQPQPLPLRLTNGPLELVIRAFGSSLIPEFEVFREGQLEDFWRAENPAFEDSSGNRGITLCRMETAWQWTAVLHRDLHAPFDAAELDTISEAPISAPGTITNLPVQLRLAGTSVTNVTMAGPGRYDWSNGVLVAAAPYAPGMGNSSLGSSSGGFPNPWTACWRACQKPFLILPDLPFAAPARLIVRVRSKGTILGEAVNGGSFKGMHFYDLPTSLPESADIDLILDPGYKFSARISPDDVPRGP